MFYDGYHYQMGEGQAVDLRRQVEHNRLESHLTKAHLANGPLSEEVSEGNGRLTMVRRHR